MHQITRVLVHEAHHVIDTRTDLDLSAIMYSDDWGHRGHIAYFNLRHPGQSLHLVHAYEQEPELSWDVGVGMRGSDASLRQRIDGVIERMLADGSIRDIYDRYGVEHRPLWAAAGHFGRGERSGARTTVSYARAGNVFGQLRV